MAWFPDRADPDLERLATLVAELRLELFRLKRLKRAQEGVWEDEADERRRERYNEEALMKWQSETRRLILGEIPPS